MSDEADEAKDTALEYARRHADRLRRAANRARWLTYASELGILTASAGTVLVAALHAQAVVTALLASTTLFLTGARTVFTPNENWVRTSWAQRELSEAIVRYLNRPESERVGAVRDAFLEQALAITRQETAEWRDVRMTTAKQASEKSAADAAVPRG